MDATQWYGIVSRRPLAEDDTAVDNTTATTLCAPADLAGPAVVYLKNVGLPDDVNRRPLRLAG
ncbi:hypothetical protein [Actinomadura alba]|uniref:Uncharacterized protein n=1 Tax=Actinomadura alba TaxID=406431 RepID=A0ABR7LR48_9ACTN|nr:hypothetical protein [Actinomadura alba]MBC6467286.1 hypothetical protein [Actinomadura alba]